MLELANGYRAGGGVTRQETHCHRIVAGARQVVARAGRPIAIQGVRDLDQYACAVAHQRIGPNGTAVVEVDQDFQTIADDLMGFTPLDVGNEAYAARVVLVTRIVKALLFRSVQRVSPLVVRSAPRPPYRLGRDNRFGKIFQALIPDVASLRRATLRQRSGALQIWPYYRQKRRYFAGEPHNCSTKMDSGLASSSYSGP